MCEGCIKMNSNIISSMNRFNSLNNDSLNGEKLRTTIEDKKLSRKSSDEGSEQKIQRFVQKVPLSDIGNRSSASSGVLTLDRRWCSIARLAVVGDNTSKKKSVDTVSVFLSEVKSIKRSAIKRNPPNSLKARTTADVKRLPSRSLQQENVVHTSSAVYESNEGCVPTSLVPVMSIKKTVLVKAPVQSMKKTFRAINLSRNSFEEFIKKEHVINAVIAKEGAKVTFLDTLKIVKKNFNPWFMKPLEKRLKGMTMSLKMNAEDFLLQVDVGDVCKKIDRKLQEIDTEVFSLYVGSTARPFSDRLAEHSNKHENTNGEPLVNVSNFEDLLLIEMTGIAYLKKLKNLKIIQRSHNTSGGYDSRSMFNGGRTNETFTVYMIWAEKLWQRNNSIGPLHRHRNVNTARVTGKLWDLNTSSAVTYNRRDIERHMYSVVRQNFGCNMCNLKFASQTSLDYHTTSVHKTAFFYYNCAECSFVGTICETRKHVIVRFFFFPNCIFH